MKKTIKETTEREIYTCDVCDREIKGPQVHARCFICGRMMCLMDTFYIDTGQPHLTPCCHICTDMQNKYGERITSLIKEYDISKELNIKSILKEWRCASIEK